MGLQAGFIYCTIQDDSRIMHTLAYSPLPYNVPCGLRMFTDCKSGTLQAGTECQ